MTFIFHIFICICLFVLFGSPEGKPVLEDKLSEVAASLLTAYDNGDLTKALEEGSAEWQKWMKSFGKSLKRKVSFHLIFSKKRYCTSKFSKYTPGHLHRIPHLKLIFVSFYFINCNFLSRENLFSCPYGFC